MTDDLFGQSPLSTLSTHIRGGLAPGQLGVVMARAGMGKSAFLVHIALGHLVRGTEVLHVSLRDQAPHVRSFYDEILAELMRARGLRKASAQLEMERNRVIHSFLSGPFTTDRLTRLLATLDEGMHFRPTVVVIDGSVEASDLDVVAWKALAQDAHLRLWCAVNLHREGGSSATDLAAGFDTAVVLEPEGNSVALRVLRAGGQDAPEAEALHLDPVTMMVEGQLPAAGEITAPSPAPQTITLISGGTTGAECAFGEAAERWGISEVNLTYDGHRQVRTNGAVTLSPTELKQGAVSMTYVNHRLKRSWDRDGPVAKVLQAQWHLVSQVRQLFVVGQIREDGTVSGGTGWSVELAKRWNRTVWVYCQEKKQWHRWSGADWVVGVPVIETTAIGGTGTRFVSDAGKAAIDDLFARSFGS